MSASAVLLKAELVAMLQIVKSRSFVAGEVEMFRRVSLNDVSVDLSVHWIIIVHGFKDVEFLQACSSVADKTPRYVDKKAAEAIQLRSCPTM